MKKIGDFVRSYKNASVVFKASIWFMAVTIIDKGISVLTQPVINRLLTVDEVGICGVYTSWYSIFSIFATFNLFCGVLEVYITKYTKNKKEIIASFCTLSLLISLVFWGLMLCFSGVFSKMLGLKKIYLVIMALGVTSDAVISFWSVPKRFEYSYKIYSVVIVGLFAVKSCLSIVGAYFLRSDRILGRLLGMVLPAVIVAVILLFIILRNVEVRSYTKYWKQGALFNLPLIPHYLATILLSSSDRIMIQKITNENDAGLYTVAYSYASLALIVFSALNNSYTPMAMKSIKEKTYKKLADVTDIIILLSVLFSVFMMLLAPEGLYILGDKKYLPALDIVPVLITGIFLSTSYCIFSNVEFVYEKNKMIFPITLAGTLVNIILNLILIPVCGYKAAAYTTFIGYLVIALAHYFVSRKIIGKDIYNIKKICVFIAILFVSTYAVVLLYHVNNFVRYAIILLLLILVCVIGVKNKNFIFKK